MAIHTTSAAQADVPTAKPKSGTSGTLYANSAAAAAAEAEAALQLRWKTRHHAGFQLRDAATYGIVTAIGIAERERPDADVSSPTKGGLNSLSVHVRTRPGRENVIKHHHYQHVLYHVPH